MAQLKDLIVTGNSRLLNTLYCDNIIGNLTGNATTATTASKLGTNAGSTTTPVYFSGGVPVACTYSLNKTVPSDAKFTDTTYSAGTGLSLSGTTFNHSNSVTAVTTATFYKIKYDAQGHITGTTAVAKSDITALGIPGSDTNTAHTHTNGIGLIRTGDGGTSGSVDYKVALASETVDTYASVSRPSASSTRIYPIIPDKNGKLAVIVPWTDNNTTYSAGTGLSLSGTTFNHSNSVTAITTAGLYKVKYDAQGHITGTTAIAKADITGLGIPGSDTNTTYTIATGDANGQIKVTPSSGSAYNVSVKGLGSAAYTASTNYATSSHVHISLKSNTDERSTNTTPDNYNGIFKIAGLKSNANIGISGHGTYSGVLGMRGWSDYSGGDAHELALAQDGALMHRHGATTTWSSWNRILTTEWTTAESWTFTLASGSTVTKNVTLQ